MVTGAIEPGCARRLDFDASSVRAIAARRGDVVAQLVRDRADALDLRRPWRAAPAVGELLAARVKTASLAEFADPLSLVGVDFSGAR